MARSLSQTLTRLTTLLTPSSVPPSTRLLTLRHRSSSAEEAAEYAAAERVALKKLEEAIHKVIVKRSQPSWIEFVPGASYWVPPKSKSQGLAHVIGNLVKDSITTTNAAGLMKDKPFALPSNRGWPSSANFFKGVSQSPFEGETIPKNTSKSEDEK